MIRVRRCADVASFIAEAGAFLAEREAEHNLMLGICSRLRTTPDPSADRPYFGIARDGDRIVAAALATPPMNLILSESDDPTAAEAFAADLFELGAPLPGVLGPHDQAAAFATHWCRLVGTRERLVMRERIYRAEHVAAAPEVDGAVRPVGQPDRDLLIAWLDAFVDEAFPDDMDKEPADDIVDRRLRDVDGGLLLWEVDDRPVSLTGFGGVTPSGVRIGPVYTPPQHRRRGFAGALVGHVTRMLLDRGYRYCFLFTDLANPTSNRIYQRVGYEPMSDVEMYLFG